MMETQELQVKWVEYEQLFARFMEAKEERNAVLEPIRARLQQAQEEWAEAQACPEAVAFAQAREDLTRFRRWAAAVGFPVPDPTKPLSPEVAETLGFEPNPFMED